MKAFKAYDVRGVYNEDFNVEDVYRIGCFIPSLLDAKEVLVGRDARISSPEIFEALARGLRDAGATVTDAGLATTPMIYWGTAAKGFDASVQITASHNAPKYNGLKISMRGALPVGADSGLPELARMCAEDRFQPAAERGGLKTINLLTEYAAFLKKWKPNLDGLKLVVDCSNGMAGLLVRDLFGDHPDYLYEEIDGTFPNHSPNPLAAEARVEIEAKVKDSYDIGVIFDGDADRVMFIDDQGQFISPDLLTAFLARYYLELEPGSKILHDIRTSRSVPEDVLKLGGEAHMWKVGHSYAKLKMRELGCVVGGELAGHYYFRDFYCCDSGMLAAEIILEIVANIHRSGSSISQAIAELNPYFGSGELNFRIEDKAGAMKALCAELPEDEDADEIHDFDGFRYDFPNWWFNVRPSNTEPYLRFLAEADTAELLEQKIVKARAILDRF